VPGCAPLLPSPIAELTTEPPTLPLYAGVCMNCRLKNRMNQMHHSVQAGDRVFRAISNRSGGMRTIMRTPTNCRSGRCRALVRAFGLTLLNQGRNEAEGLTATYALRACARRRRSRAESRLKLPSRPIQMCWASLSSSMSALCNPIIVVHKFDSGA
jgi:hypothetical protein